MRHFIICSVLISFFYSCEQETRYQMRIIIRNETDNNLSLSLLPKANYIVNGGYDYSEISGGYRHLTFEITPGNEQELYVTSDLKIQPNNLALQVFTGIQVSTLNREINDLKFSPDTVIGYSENLYKETSNWIYEIRDFDLNTQFSSKPVESHDYTFVISLDHYLK